MSRVSVMNEFVSTQFKCEILAEHDEVVVTDLYGNKYNALSSNTSTTPDGEPILYVDNGSDSGYIFIETIRVIEGEEL